jgi:uncharacterized membrane protein YphA (DoxX/SURF4 family)
VSSRHQIPFRTFLWEYLGHPDDETPERRRVLYAIVMLRLGFGLLFLLRGWSAVFATPPDAFATRLGDPARVGLGGAAVDTMVFIVGCTELAIGALLLFGAFTRVSAVTGLVLATLSLALGERNLFPPSSPSPLRYFWEPFAVAAINVGSLIALIGGLLLVVICGTPFLSADRALDKLEEEERDRAPAQLPRIAAATPLLLRVGLAGAIWWHTFWFYGIHSAIYLPVHILSLVCGVPLLLGIGTRVVVIPFVLFAAMGVIAGHRVWPEMEWLIPAIPTVAVALLISGPGSVRVGQRSSRSAVPSAAVEGVAGQ